MAARSRSRASGRPHGLDRLVKLGPTVRMWWGVRRPRTRRARSRPAMLLVFTFILSAATIPSEVPGHVRLHAIISAITPRSIPGSLFAVFVARKDDSRVPVLDSYITESLLRYNVSSFEWRYVNYKEQDDTESRSLSTPQFWRDEVKSHQPTPAVFDGTSANLVAADFFSLSHFVANRTERWFYRGVDDSIINFRVLPDFLAWLEGRYDPLVDAVVKGDCVAYFGRMLYLQGGAGFLCSRRAAEKMAAALPLFMSVSIAAEDTTSGPFLDALGILVNRSCCGAFMGHGPDFLWLGRAPCPRREKGGFLIPRHLTRLRDVVVFHRKNWAGNRLERAMGDANTIFNADAGIRWYTEDLFWPAMCQGSRELQAADPFWEFPVSGDAARRA